jgi:hypothetical protein
MRLPNPGKDRLLVLPITGPEELKQSCYSNIRKLHQLTLRQQSLNPCIPSRGGFDWYQINTVIGS